MSLPKREEAERSHVAVMSLDAVRPRWLPPDGAGLHSDVLDPAADDGLLAGQIRGATAVFIDQDVQAPLSMARRLHRLAPGLQLAVVADPDVREQLQQSMLFVPGLGELWIVAPEDVTPGLMDEAAAIGRRRRRHAARSRHVARQVAELTSSTAGRPFLADQYLATLVELLPDPVLALDENGSVVFVNPPAAALLGLERRDSVSADRLREALHPEDPLVWARLLDSGRERVARGEIEMKARGERRFYSVAVAPVQGERPVRALLLHDVTEQVEAREELAERADELRTLMSHRSRFYASMNHELRTPVNAILGYTDLLEAGIYGGMSDPQRAALERIGRATRHLLDLVDDTLDLSKVEAGRIRVHPGSVDLPEIVKDLDATVRPLAENRGVDLRFDIHASCTSSFSTDPQRLRQILTNLLSNAIRHGAGAPVEVRCRCVHRRLILEVEDRGPGIPEDDQERIFDEFVQLDGDENGGTGLGLAISRSLARALGGDLTVESEGEGSLFRLEVPWLEEGREDREADIPDG